jgi:predicted MFS family arabinose efflux permease
MNVMYWAIVGLGAFVAIWMLFVVPAERRHHERKLEMIQKKLEKRQARQNQENSESAVERDSDIKES